MTYKYFWQVMITQSAKSIVTFDFKMVTFIYLIFDIYVEYFSGSFDVSISSLK